MHDHPQKLLVHPDWRFLLAHPAHFIALGVGSGLAKKAPGTFGTLAALPLYALLIQCVSPLSIAWLCLPVFLIGCWASEITGNILGVHDFGGIVIDEIVAMWLVLLFVPLNPRGWLFAFALFRLFDIFKPWPICWFDQRVPGGIGVMIDDILAAGYAILVLLAIQYFYAL
ncbi:phosphatidylglycerophosphatase A [Iodobacter sp.]|uniref:phosphatidylglycerophosphatase A family protein n=1 Tax=Iodobacter sp. TaxID=1915058 RepID=UPI002600553A|nr:phosphatidylglycerophosphatase A [Iodobacter sp.]